MTERIVIAGIGHTAFGALPGRSTVSLTVEAVASALSDAGIERDRVDALFIKPPTSIHETLYGAKVAEALGLRGLGISGAWDQGGAANISLVNWASLALAAGQCTVAVVGFADTSKTGGNRAVYGRARNPEDDLFGWYSTAAHFALFGRRHMLQHGTTPEQFGQVAVTIRGNGAQNPNAQLRKPLTMDEYLDGPLLVAPLRRDDCALISDGGAALVLMTESTAREIGVDRPIAVLGYGQGLTSPTRSDLTVTGLTVAAEAAFAMAGLTPADVDTAQFYDCFTPTVITAIEDCGFAPKGRGGAFVEEGRIGATGDLPINTSGGLLSETGMPGMQLIIEAVRQLRGTARLQVSGASTALVTGQGGSMQTHSALILGA